MNFIESTIYLVVAVFITFLGLKFGAYGLVINILSEDVKVVTPSEIRNVDFSGNRQVRIINACSLDYPIESHNKFGHATTYLYPILENGCNSDTTEAKQCSMVIEVPFKINRVDSFNLEGLLKPHWYSIEDEIIHTFSFRGVEIEPDGYFLDVGQKPVKWYWNLGVLFLSGLFFYRLTQAFIKRLRFKNFSI